MPAVTNPDIKTPVKPMPELAPMPRISPFPPEKLCPEQTKRITE